MANMWTASQLPSAYDPGIRINDAFQTAKTPLLVEFYSDTCGTCQRVAPMVHEIVKENSQRLTLVMMNVDDPDTASIAQLFGVKELPAIYVFNPKKMKKQVVDAQYFATRETLSQAIETSLSKAI
jgi:thioredoxin 1